MRNFLKITVSFVFGVLFTISLFTWGHKIGFQFINVKVSDLKNVLYEFESTENKLTSCRETTVKCVTHLEECEKIGNTAIQELDQCVKIRDAAIQELTKWENLYKMIIINN